MSQREPWRNQERHYCAVCNSWMGSDRQSILIHENGKKHKEQFAKNLEQKRHDKLQEEKDSKSLHASIQKINEAAALAHVQDVSSGNFARPLPPVDLGTTQIIRDTERQTQKQTQPSKQARAVQVTTDKDSWEARKKKRQEEVAAKFKAKEDSNNKDVDDDATDLPTVRRSTKRKLGPEEGHYKIGDTTYLEGPTFVPLLEEDMPIQIWTGSRDANLTEKKLAENFFLWKSGLVIQTRKISLTTINNDTGMVVDAAYLLRTTDTDETLEKSIAPDRIRITLGGDDMIPDTLEEARLTVMGGEIITLFDQQSEINTDHDRGVVVDENTGLSSWGTVEIKRTTVRNELKEERDRMRAKRRREIEEIERQRHETEGRKMEEAKVGNADDSALGAFDVFSSGKAGYKGVDINKESKLEVHETAKRLSKGMGCVGFKKRSGSSAFKQAKKKQNRRITSADDD